MKTLSSKNKGRARKPTGELQRDVRVNPICISATVSHDLVYPVKSDPLPVVLFQDVFRHL